MDELSIFSDQPSTRALSLIIPITSHLLTTFFPQIIPPLMNHHFLFSFPKSAHLLLYVPHP